MKHTSSRSAFSSIELMVSIAILGILAVLLAVNYGRTQSLARDSARKADVAVIGAAVSQFVAANGTSFIRMPISGTPGQYETCTLPPDISGPSGPQPDMSVPGSGVGCVGANGRAYGKVNVKGVTLANAVSGQERIYANSSIIEALVAANYLDSSPKDPKNSVGVLDTVDKAQLPDYVLVRSCPIPSGTNKNLQYVGDRGGSVYAVWAQLENAPIPADVANRSKSAGSFTTDNAPVWSWDLAVSNLAEYKALQSNGYVNTNTLIQTAKSVDDANQLAQGDCSSANS